VVKYDAVWCPTCQRESRDDARFCDECGSVLTERCSRCGRELRVGARFCDGCGQRRRAGSDADPPRPGPSAPPPEALRSAEAERRQLTVMFCDLVGSTALSTRLDPEDLLEVIRAYQRAAGEVVHRFGGHLAQYLGDGLLIYFGYPRALEDAAYRAVQTGLEIVEAIRRLRTRMELGEDAPIAVRLAIHTGPVVVGEMGEGNRDGELALGQTPNVAARLQELAEPDCVVISAATARLVQGRFALEEMGAHLLKGIDDPIVPSRVLGLLEERGDTSREDERDTSFLVGRGEEIDLLKRRWEQCKDGVGQVVLINGEAGIGKSTLVHTLRRNIEHEADSRITFRCSAHHQNSPLRPLSEYLGRILGFSREDTPESKLVKLERMLEGYRFANDETVCLLADLLAIPIPEDRHPALELSPRQQRQRTHDALAAWLIEETRRHPVLVVMEDVHWADPSSLEVIGLLVEQAPTARMLIVLTYRPEFVPPWPMRSHISLLVLTRLPRQQVEGIVSHLAGGKTIPAEVIEHLVRKTDGVPLFAEELTKMVLESNVLTAIGDRYELTGPLSELAIPSTLQDSLMARLDRLPGVREVAQLSAVIGREFSYEVLRELTTVEESVLQMRLKQLVEAELVYQRGHPPHSTYVFKHALIQDAAYSSMLRRTRQRYHHQVAELFEKRFPEIVETEPEVVAHHYANAGLMEQALGYWYQAGRSAAQRSANPEAIAHLTKGLEALAGVSDESERIHRELDLQMTLGSALTAMRGHGAPEVEHTYAKARELCQRLGDTPRLCRVLAGICAHYIARGPASTARELAGQLLPLAKQQGDSRLLLTAHANVGATSFMIGSFTSAADHLERGILLSEAQPRQGRPAQDQGVICYSWAALNLFVLGHPDESLKRSREAVALARSLDSRYSLAFALYFASFLHRFRREGEAAQACAEEAMAVSSEEFALWWAGAKLFRGWALAEQGNISEGLVQARDGLEAWLSSGARVSHPHYLALLAELHMRAGEVAEGIHLLDEALGVHEKLAEGYYEAELHRLMGELMLVDEDDADQTTRRARAEACFGRALEISRRQRAKSWELRAATSLARLWREDRKQAEARGMLSEIIEWFTEGLDTKDLREAKTLLAEL
jgi:class 3 adenylate cyclase/predicted ATPase/energy-coupling factor transporter ATP-binding protein EcfA2